ncbi:AbrB/MazE/SpoVT family DNA-binding domain-containing protein [Lentibacillus saliphilus]|uniref:AbrB/MazE/SpoVT family DNA-binding domain-containing protein n=1 Tax=Lentibacillus saliphilus TaxID=2737028 RepID=UPI001C30B546|nr:AbrB/MazE/SpoVT family DNA-binding domain-containing protein [Lentibacillus saliphilus]
MKSTGIVRKVDDLGRIVIPKELRRSLNIDVKDPLEIYVDQEKIILQKYNPDFACLLTGEISDDNMSLADGKIVLSKHAALKLIEDIKQNLENE